MKKVDLYELNFNPFGAIGKEWMLITAKKDGKVNTMTAAWGGLGFNWNMPVATAYIRPQRYTKEFVDAGDTFTLTFFGGEFKKEMGYLGKVSGRDEDKIANAGMKLIEVDGEPTFEGATMTLVCRKVYEDTIKPECFTEAGVDARWYPDKDYHVMYIAEVVTAYVAD